MSSGMVQWLGQLALTQKARVRFPVPESNFERSSCWEGHFLAGQKSVDCDALYKFFSHHSILPLHPMRHIHTSGPQCCRLEPSNRACLQQHGRQMAASASPRLDMCLEPQQTAEMNMSHCLPRSEAFSVDAGVMALNSSPLSLSLSLLHFIFIPETLQTVEVGPSVA